MTDPTVRITRGSVTPEEAAALVVALAQVSAERAPAPPVPPPSGWLQAARLEGVGGGRVSARADLAARPTA